MRVSTRTLLELPQLPTPGRAPVLLDQLAVLGDNSPDRPAAGEVVAQHCGGQVHCLRGSRVTQSGFPDLIVDERYHCGDVGTRRSTLGTSATKQARGWVAPVAPVAWVAWVASESPAEVQRPNASDWQIFSVAGRFPR